MRLALTLGLCALLAASPVLANPLNNAATVSSDVASADAVASVRAVATCGWSAGMEEDEGGPVMGASSCESETETGPALRLYCGNIRYNGNGLGLGDNPPASSTLVLTAGGTSLTVDVLFEEMDGAFAAYVGLDSPIVALLKTGDEVGVTFKGLDLPSRMISLKGSSAAIDELSKSCAENGAGE